MSDPLPAPFPEWRSKHINRVTLRPMILEWVEEARAKDEIARISGLALSINMLDEAEELYEMYVSLHADLQRAEAEILADLPWRQKYEAVVAGILRLCAKQSRRHRPRA